MASTVVVMFAICTGPTNRSQRSGRSAMKVHLICVVFWKSQSAFAEYIRGMASLLVCDQADLQAWREGSAAWLVKKEQKCKGPTLDSKAIGGHKSAWIGHLGSIGSDSSGDSIGSILGKGEGSEQRSRCQKKSGHWVWR